ncbi:hypothetical protein O0I10_011188 [Lichtheimia ornata]|uniref:HNH nuclease domain-containing protein n=1 Tax=Lichtheimia ornata TaxID=688661 RepID=A0AAD7UT80_9FUNG|nr:uncharacterized protein O0I10_011188 [Lichtheimia ornata]KAJ8653139.1 hypothetical protein O0I10_011188 [Lichtheimia ornata]
MKRSSLNLMPCCRCLIKQKIQHDILFLGESYLISDLGRVFSLYELIFMAIYFPATIHDSLSYGSASLRPEGVWVKQLVHRLVMITFHGLRANMYVDHKNKKRSDNRPCNLEWVTAEENERRKRESPSPFDPRIREVALPDTSDAAWVNIGVHCDGSDYSAYEICKEGVIRRVSNQDPVGHLYTDTGYVMHNMDGQQFEMIGCHRKAQDT